MLNAVNAGRLGSAPEPLNALQGLMGMPISGIPPVTGRKISPPSGMAKTGRPPVAGMIKRGPMLSSCDGEAVIAGAEGVASATEDTGLPSVPGTVPNVAQPAMEKTKIKSMTAFICSTPGDCAGFLYFATTTLTQAQRFGLPRLGKDRSRSRQARAGARAEADGYAPIASRRAYAPAIRRT